MFKLLFLVLYFSCTYFILKLPSVESNHGFLTRLGVLPLDKKRLKGSTTKRYYVVYVITINALAVSTLEMSKKTGMSVNDA